MMTEAVEQIRIPYEPRDWQAKAHAAIPAHRFNTLIVHRRGGKTYLSVALLVTSALATERGRFAYFAPLLKQAKSICWNLLKEFTLDVPGVEFRETELRATFPNGSEIMLFAGESHDAVRGMGFDGIVLDEVAQFPADAWGSSIRPTLSDRNGWLVAIGTPRGIDQLHEFFVRGQDPQQAEWWSAVFRADETGVLSHAELKSAREVSSPQQYEREYLCSFDASTDDVLIPLGLVTEACGREIVREEQLYGLPRIIAVDVARFGADSSVILRRWGNLVLEPLVIQDADLMHLSGLVAKAIRQWQSVDAVFIDETGLGSGVVDRLRQVGFNAYGVNFGAKSYSPKYANKRAEMWDEMKAWLEQGGVLPSIPEIKADLSAPTYSFDASNRMKLEPKHEVKKRLGRSPDLGDALALTFAMPVVAQDLTIEGGNNVLSDFDPYEPMENEYGN